MGVCLSLRNENKCHCGPFFSASLWPEMEVQQRRLHRNKHPPQEKGATHNKCEQSDCFACKNLSRVLFCSRHRVQCATISEVLLRERNRGRSASSLALTATDKTDGGGRRRHAGGWRGAWLEAIFPRWKNALPTGCSRLFWGHVQIKALRHVKQPETRHSGHRGSSCPSSPFAHDTLGRQWNAISPFFLTKLSSETPACAGRSAGHVWGGSNPVDSNLDLLWCLDFQREHAQRDNRDAVAPSILLHHSCCSLVENEI